MYEETIQISRDRDDVRKQDQDKFERLMFLKWYGEFCIEKGDREWTWPAYEMN